MIVFKTVGRTESGTAMAGKRYNVFNIQISKIVQTFVEKDHIFEFTVKA